jgi:hypothetical protein
MAVNGLSARKQQSNGNQGITPAKRKIAAQQLSIAPANRKIVVRQSGYRASQKKHCGAVIGVLRQPLQKLRGGNQGLRQPLEKLRHGNWGIAPAS